MWQSNDGIDWEPVIDGTDSRLINAGDLSLITPEIDNIRSEGQNLIFDLRFSIPDIALPEAICPDSWKYPDHPELHCKNSQIHQWTIRLRR